MAQLQMSPMMDGDGYGDGSQRIDATTMAHTCLRMRVKCDSNGENLCLRSILTSFFLHVYHAKVNQRNSAMMFIQEAIAGSRILRLDEGLPQPKDGLIANQDLVFPLLWVSERGYSLHLGLSPSYTEPPTILGIESSIESDVHAQGLLELVRLFVAKKLSSLSFSMADHVSTRSADYHVTREWMRTIIWQEALAMGLLSSAAYTSVMTFGFPAQVGRDLLQALRGFREADLLPLGRDQLLKCFEVANSLADTVLLRSTLMSSRRELGPHDFLHALYQKIVPFLEQDRMLLGILRAKTAEALVTAPARLLTMNGRSSGLYGLETETDQRTHLGGYLPYEVAEQSDLETNSLNFSQQGLQMI
ncbi:hypothetical protein N7522_011509 [Penicillium canescens]|uniref:Uncharacterized protein n=1 Tax=Penicillium canescens TaxID=5083 RepID=A0AAD6IN03_PENCN|nr:uncharacterized protein N7446_007230 [Penicillium canescens]KAJ5991302.1 hypothetical protein N7522_011509 [Penicillium canescens]KAJ6052591.1 hypothetical protein N7460_003125 [Penicillium canescens]KAJ6063110.1 hypothetical protein N7446_007230 [Penicillium canescens]